MISRLLLSGTLALACLAANGCAIGALVGAVGSEIERNKKIEVLAQYDDFEGMTVAILVDVDPMTMYEHPSLVSNITQGIVTSFRRNVPSARVMPAELSLQWQYSTPGWNAMAFGDMAESIQKNNIRAYGPDGDVRIDRIIHVEIVEYRLNPPGNRYEWDGVCAANVRVIENDEGSYDPDFAALDVSVVAKFPDQSGVGWESASADRIALGLLVKFVEETVWLFYDHEEWKYPDRRSKDAT